MSAKWTNPDGLKIKGDLCTTDSSTLGDPDVYTISGSGFGSTATVTFPPSLGVPDWEDFYKRMETVEKALEILLERSKKWD
jgi:hypothetical protein